MRFGVFRSLMGQTWAGVLELWQHLEATGWDTACVSDHFMPNTKDREGPVVESWSTLSALAAVVPRMRIGTIVLGNTYRHPAVVAKMAAQVDIISYAVFCLKKKKKKNIDQHKDNNARTPKYENGNNLEPARAASPPPVPQK